MAKNKGLTLEDLMKGRESIQEEQRGEGVGMRNAIAAAVTPSLTPIAQSLGKLQQVTETAELEKGQISSISAVDKSVSKAIVDTSKNIEKLLTSSNDLNKLINDNNGILSKQLEETKAFNKYSVKMFEELVERINRDREGVVSSDLQAPAALSQITPSTELMQQEVASKAGGINVGAPDINVKGWMGRSVNAAAQRSLLSRAMGSLAVGGLGAAAGAALYGVSPEFRQGVQKVGLDEEAVTVLSGLLANALTGPLAALTSASIGLSYIGTRIMAGDEGKKLFDIQKKETEQFGGSLTGALAGPSGEAAAILHSKGFEEGATPQETEQNRQNYIAKIERERKLLENAPFQTKYLGVGRTDYLRRVDPEEDYSRESNRAGALGGLRRSNVTITPYTLDITDERAKEIFRGRGNAADWLRLTPQQRSENLRIAQEAGVRDLDPSLQRQNSGFAPGSMRNEEIPSLESLQSSTSAAPSTRFGTFNLSTSEDVRNAGTTAAPTIIRGGDTINNVTNVTGGSGGSSGPGSPSIQFNPWDPLSIGRPWQPYASGWAR